MMTWTQKLRITAVLMAGMALMVVAPSGLREAGTHVSCVAHRLVQCYETIRLVYDLERQFKKSGERSGAYVMQSTVHA